MTYLVTGRNRKGQLYSAIVNAENRITAEFAFHATTDDVYQVISVQRMIGGSN